MSGYNPDDIMDYASDEYEDSSDVDGDNDDSYDDSCYDDDDGFRRRGGGGEFTEMKEQMYQDKLADLKRQLQQLQEGSLPEYVKRLKKLEGVYRERIRINNVIRDLEVEMVEQDFINEKKAAAREFEDHKVYLKDQLINELEEKQKMIENERHSMDLTGDSMELKTVSTRKLRRRANEPSGPGGYGNSEKRRKPLQLSSLTYMLEDTDILDDLKIINKNKALSHIPAKAHMNTAINASPGITSSSPSATAAAVVAAAAAANAGGGSSFDSRHMTRIEDGKLFYQRRWFRRGQSVQIEHTKNGDKYPAMISAIGSDAIWVKKNDNVKSRIYLSQLNKGKFVIKRRAN